ncbi:MAG: caspase family protein [Pseudorhodoplanes sp.]
MLRRLILILASAIVAGGLASPAAAQRVALVIGNSDYKNVTALKNPVNDATDIGTALSRMEFTVTTLTNGTAEEMRRAVAEFGEKAKGADIAVIFFAGHAVEADGLHWSIPIDGKVNSLEAITSQSVSLDRLLATGSKLTIVLIDTARDNPFAKDSPQAPSTKPHAQPQVRDALIVYSTRSGSRPLDGEGRNSPFAAALLKHIETPGVDFSRLMNRVRDEVLAETNGKQTPFSYGSLPGGDVLLAPR